MNAAINSRKKPQGKNKIIHNLSLCIIQKYNGYTVIKVEKKTPRKRIEPTDIVYDPVKNFDSIVNCYFTFHLHLPYFLQYSRGKKKLKFFMHFNAIHAVSFILLKKHLKS